MGSSHEPGTVCTIMFDSFTPQARSFALVPARRGSMIAVGVGEISSFVSFVYLLAAGWCGELTCVPAGVDDSNAESTTIVHLSFSGAFESCHDC